MKPITLCLIHHSHTDIGYTDYQEKIELHQVHFIKEVVEILRAAHTTHPEWLGFKWNCESFWCVERFLEFADKDPDLKRDFISFVKSGEIGLSGSYLNLTELVDDITLRNTLKKCQNTASSFGVSLRSALTADINGYSWGFSDALIENGITRLLSCIHTHHGYHPLHLKQTPFYWESPTGKKLFVWNGEHYLLGNELGIARAPAIEYTIRDGLNSTEPDLFCRAEKRIKAYVESLINAGYNYDFVPVNLSGMMTDNGFPNVTILDFCKKYNEIHKDEIRLQMMTLDEFFDLAESKAGNIPVYSGDWTDWWADGVGSTPDVVMHSREAARKLQTVRALDPEGKLCGKELMEKAEYNLMFYAEHTWGYSSSVSEPWHPNVNRLDKRKSLFAGKANEYASRALDKITYYYGETPPSLQKDFALYAINPHDRRVTDSIKLNMEFLFGHSNFEVIDSETGKAVNYQLGSYARGPIFVLEVTLEAHQKKKYILRDIAPAPLASAGRCAPSGIEGVYDLHYRFEQDLKARGYTISPYRIETPYFRITLDEEKGIASIYDKKKQAELVKPDAKYPPFCPIYEVTPTTRAEQCDTRRRMGRNRKSTSTRRYAGVPRQIRVLEEGPLYSCLEIEYELEGSEFASLLLTTYNNLPRVDIDFRLHKRSVWEPENLYLALPFTAGEGEEFYIEKTGAILRPRVDQLPGTCTDFYALQSGMCFTSKAGSVIVATPDTPLITIGTLCAHEIVLAGEEGAKNIDQVYGWVMNNFWETNFKVSLGGFHQFRYSLISTKETSPSDAISTAREACAPIVGFYAFTEEKQ